MIFSRPSFRIAVRALSAPILALTALASYGADAHAEEEVNIYSYREPGLIDPILKEFTKETGIKTNVVFSKDGLIERMTAEGRNSPADVLLVNESGLLFKAKEAGITQPLQSKVIDEKVDAKLRDPEHHWFAITQRARVVYASKDRVKQDAITYEELADPKWKGKICIRSGQHTYNIALVASMIAHHGEEKAEAWLTGLRDNLARKPAGGDREGVRDVQAGLCDLAIGNTYYMAAMLNNPEQKAWADSVRILFPNAADRGTHVNVSGGALAANAPHKDSAVKLLEFFVSHEAQELYADQSGEYPVVADAHASALVKSWGELKPDPISLDELAKLRKQASELVDKVRFDAGPSS
jgi:iron(III) transport system substrate-binding protein